MTCLWLVAWGFVYRKFSITALLFSGIADGGLLV